MEDLMSFQLQSGFFTMQYSYFARIDLLPKWPPRGATHPKDLTEKSLSGDRLVMSDVYYRWGGRWGYNHGKNGSSLHYSTTEYSDDGSTGMNVTGINNLYGDGHVIWKKPGRGKGFLEWDEIRNLRSPHVRGDGSDANFY